MCGEGNDTYTCVLELGHETTFNVFEMAQDVIYIGTKE